MSFFFCSNKDIDHKSRCSSSLDIANKINFSFEHRCTAYKLYRSDKNE